MSRRHLRWGGGLAAAGACLVLGMAAQPPGRSASADALPDLGALPPFTLIDHAHRPVTRDTLAGRVWVADFIFTRCAGQCPLIQLTMQHVVAALAAEPTVRCVSFTVDPSHDTPPVLAEYARHLRAPADRWLFLTGPEPDVQRLIRDGFRLSIAGEGTAAEPITHSIRLVLVDRAGHVRGYYPADEPAAVTRLLRDVRALLADPG